MSSNSRTWRLSLLLGVCAAAATLSRSEPAAACRASSDFEDTQIHQVMRQPGWSLFGSATTASGCWPDLARATDAYLALDDSWSGPDVGRDDPCNPLKPFGQMVASTYLIFYALLDGVGQFHHSAHDYGNLAQAVASIFHDDVYTVFSNQAGVAPNATSSHPFLGRDYTSYHCALFEGDPDGHDGFAPTANSTARRAGTIVHESWHQFLDDVGLPNAHAQGPTGSCTVNGVSCDNFVPHRISDFPPGTLHTVLGRFPHYHHSAYQIQAEFLCDLAEFSKSYIPIPPRNRALNAANNILATRFINAVGYRCGTPRPF